MRLSTILIISYCVALKSFSADTPASAVSLEESFRSALLKNEEIGQGQERIEQAADRAAQARGAILPDLRFNVFHQIQPEPADLVARSFSPAQQTTANFSVSQPIFRGLKEFSGLSQLNHLRDAAEANLKDTKGRLFALVAGSYLQILSLEQDLKNLKEQADIYQKRSQDLKARAGRGESNQTDVVSAEATYSSLQAEIKLVEGQYASARENFRFITGLAADTPLKDPQIQISQLPALAQFIDKIESRADVMAAREQYIASDKSVSVAWAGHFPTLDAVGNYYVKRPGFLSDLKWDIGLRLTVPLFEGGATHARVLQATSERREAELALARLRRSAEQEIRSLYQRLQARRDHIEHLKRSSELTRRNSALMQRDYLRGLARNIDVQLALTEERVAQRSYDQAYFAAQNEWFQLQVATAQIPYLKD